MNDTILNDRQKEILKILKDKGEISRSGISSLFPEKDASKITIIRDLKHLIDLGLIKSKGKARNTTIFCYSGLDARDGIEPSLTASKAAVLPLDDLALLNKQACHSPLYHNRSQNSTPLP